MDEHDSGTWKLVLVFGVLIAAVFIVSVYIQTLTTTKEINENQDLQLDTRQVQNDYRNQTLGYLSTINETVHKQQITLDSIQDNMIHVPLVNNGT